MCPSIGIGAAIERVRWGPWDAEADLSPRTYARAVQAAGGLALILPPDQRIASDPDSLLERLDGLILAGGSDIDPATYGKERHPATGTTWPERDRFEAALAARAVERGMPVLGICRGMQLLNVALGGTLDQHLPDSLGHDAHCHRPGAFGEHEVHLQPGSLAARAAGAEQLLVKSHHHQGVQAVGEGLVASGWSLPEDVVEALELPGKAFALGVLWHPEEDTRSRVIGSLVEAARSGVPA